jgi:hypothetical protein
LRLDDAALNQTPTTIAFRVIKTTIHKRMLATYFALLTVFAAATVHAAAGCPSGVFFQPDATGSQVDAGWSGISHDMPVLGYSLRMDVSCGPSSPPCGTCSLSGPIANAGGNNQRCTNDTSIICTPATEVTDCGAPGLCHFFLAPITPISAGGISSCYTSEITGAVTGTVDVESGALSPNVPMKASLWLGATIDNPCPRCIGDPTPNDNVRGGSCSGGSRNGLSCDANATAELPDFGVMSFDCPLPAISKIADFVLGTVNFSTGTQTRTLSAANPACTAAGTGGFQCFCQTCNNGNGEACQTNADCPDPAGPVGPICGGRRCILGSNAGAPCTVNSECPGGGVCNRPGTATAPNGCIDDTNTPGVDCDDLGGGNGFCTNGPFDNHCTIASGHPQRGCLVDGDCGGALNSCDTFLRPCFLDRGVVGGTVAVSGVATPPVGNTSNPTDLGALTCLTPTSASSVNVVGGFPGLARGFYPGKMILAEEILVEVVPPGGTATTSGSGPASVVETTVTSPNAGEITIIGTFNTGTPPSGYTFLGRLVQIEAPAASPGSPLQISFDIAASEIPPGENENTIALFRNGVGPIPNCLGSTQAVPSPCITARTPLGGGDVRITVLTAAASEWTMGVAAAPPSGPNKCTEGKDKCVGKKAACKLGCHAKAENSGQPVDPLCIQKCEDKFDGGANPSKGCFVKLENKYGAGCVSSGDTGTLETTVDTFVDDVVTDVDPAYPAPVQNKCSAGKKKCVAKKTFCKLGCYAKAHGKGIPVDGGCLQKCEDKFDGGGDPSKGCFAKLEAKGGCPTNGDTEKLEIKVDAFVDDVACKLAGPGSSTCCTAGTRIGPGCWQLGAVSQSCVDVCTATGQIYDPATSSYAGSGGTDVHCNAVLDALGAGPGTFPYVNTTCGVASECILAVAGPDSQRARCNDTPEDPSASNGFHRRACACVAP